MNKRKSSAAVGVFTILLLLLVIGSGTYIVYDQGYIPYKEIQPYREPEGSVPVDVASNTDPNKDCCQVWLNTMLEDFELGLLKYKLYTINSLVQTASGVFDTYAEKMVVDDFSPYSTASEKPVTPTIWDVSGDGYTIKCGLWIKGLTVVALFVTTCPAGQPFDTASSETTNCILYMTGYIGDYKKVFEGSEFIPVFSTP